METRIHIGNISNNLAENPSSLNTRLTKYGEIIKPLEIKTKPSNTHHFGFITLKITKDDFEKLKKSLHNVLFMGLKLTISKAKADYKTQWEEDHKREVKTRETDRVQWERERRIMDASSKTHLNPITKESVKMYLPNGYIKSAHTFNNISGNVKNSAPTQTLIGSKSYGSLTHPKKYYDQSNSMISGGGDVIRGRIRKTPRSKTALKAQTLRILVNGTLKQFKAYKTKLWGMEKNKTLNDLTWKYVNGQWKSGDDHVIERFICSINGVQANNYGKDLETHEVNEPEVSNEKDKSLAVLSTMLGTYDFDKPAEIDGEDEDEVVVDQKGRKKTIRFDYEVEGEIKDSDMDLVYDKEAIEKYKSEVQRPQGEVYYDEDDEGNELDFDSLGQQYSTENIIKGYNEAHKVEEEPEEQEEDQLENEQEQEEEAQEQPDQEEEQENESDSEDEPMPSFGQPTNNTEALRSLFNPQETTFNIGIEAEDIDETKGIDEEDQKLVLKQLKKDVPKVEKPVTKSGLFWFHDDSPFLQTQSQLSRLGYDGEKVKLPGENEGEEVEDGDENETPYEQWFWKMRGEVTRECKRRRRDVLRILKKKTFKSMTI